MTTSITDFRTLMLNILGDPSGTRYNTTALDAALRSALREYTQASPSVTSTVLNIGAANREISLATLAGFLGVLEVNYPYTTADLSPRPYPAFYVFHLAGAPTLRFTGGRVPKSGEKARIVYSCHHTITSLDSATATTIPAIHENSLATGAAAFAAFTRASNINEAFGTRKDEFTNLITWASTMLESYRAWLRTLNSQISGHPFHPSAWTLDAKDTRPHGDGSFDRELAS